MASHFVSLNRGESGFKFNEFATGTASTAGDDFELRVSDTGGAITKKDVILALAAFARFFENPQQVAPTGFDVRL
jgi:hypothetical protein